MKIVVTGAGGLIGRHTAVRIHAENCAALYAGSEAPFELALLDHSSFEDSDRLCDALSGADAVLHFAGVNRASDNVLEAANPEIAQHLAEACESAGVRPHVVYSNSIHASTDTPYGRSKRRAADILAGIGGAFTDLVLPHIFGEGARPFYNNVTATFIQQVIAGEYPHINANGRVSLLHAGDAAQTAIDAVKAGMTGIIRPQGRETPVFELFGKLEEFHRSYAANVFPDLRDPFDVSLFNSYRTALYRDTFGKPLTQNIDSRGILFEAVKGGGGGQTFLSSTKPGVTRGNHFHLNKVERFLVVEGKAIIRIRKLLTDVVKEYDVSGDDPKAYDMPTLHTHSIENVGDTPLLTLFWTHEQFDPASPDTYSEHVLKA